MGIISVVLVVVAWLALLESRALCQCPQLTESLLEDLTVKLLEREGSEGGTEVDSVVLNDYQVNCLAAESTRGYKEATATVNYTTNTDVTGAGQVHLDCFSTEWRVVQRINLPRTANNMEVTVEGLLASETDASCISCSPFVSGGPASPSFCSGRSKNAFVVVHRSGLVSQRCG